MTPPSIEIGKAPDGSIVIRTTITITAELAGQLGASLTKMAGSGLVIPTLTIAPPPNGDT